MIWECLGHLGRYAKIQMFSQALGLVFFFETVVKPFLGQATLHYIWWRSSSFFLSCLCLLRLYFAHISSQKSVKNSTNFSDPANLIGRTGYTYIMSASILSGGIVDVLPTAVQFKAIAITPSIIAVSATSNVRSDFTSEFANYAGVSFTTAASRGTFAASYDATWCVIVSFVLCGVLRVRFEPYNTT